MILRLEQFDICILASTPNGIVFSTFKTIFTVRGQVIAFLLIVLLIYCSRVLNIVVQMVFMEHIPVEQHMILFTLGMLCQNSFRVIIDYFFFYTDWVKIFLHLPY